LFGQFPLEIIRHSQCSQRFSTFLLFVVVLINS